MNVLEYVATNECEHKWDLYEDLPGGEDPLRYRQCTKCGQIVAVAASEHKDRLCIRSLHCYVCGSAAVVGRNWGRRMYAARVRWACAEHLKQWPIFDKMLERGVCKTCGTDLPVGSRVRMRPVEENRHEVYHLQCMACFVIEQGSN